MPGSISGDYTITAALGTTPEIEFGAAYGHVIVPAASSLTTLNVYGSADGANYYQVVIDGSDYVITVESSNFYCLKPEVYGVPHLKFVGNAGGSVTFCKVLQGID